MKKLTAFIFFILLCSGRIYSQPFGACGATWHYNVNTWLPPFSNVPVINTVSLPFMIGNDTCRTIQSNWGVGCSALNNFDVTQRNDSVLYFSYIKNEFVLLYNYNAMVGDTQTIFAPEGDGTDTSVQLLVTATGSMNINGHIKRTYSVSQLTYFFEFNGLIIEDIGAVNYPFPQFGFCDPSIGSIRCYEDSIVGLYNFNPAIDCDSIITVGINETSGSESMIVYPNPFGSYLTILNVSQDSASDLIIRDPLGRVIKTFHFATLSNSNSLFIDLIDLSNGVYFLEVIQEEELRWVKKIIKQ